MSDAATDGSRTGERLSGEQIDWVVTVASIEQAPQPDVAGPAIVDGYQVPSDLLTVMAAIPRDLLFPPDDPGREGSGREPPVELAELPAIRARSEQSAAGSLEAAASSGSNGEALPAQDAVAPVTPSSRGSFAAPATRPAQLEAAAPAAEASATEPAGFLNKLLTNSFESNSAGWAANVLHASVRDGGITWATTLLREFTGKAALQKLDGVPDDVRAKISGGILAAHGLLNMLATAGQEWEGSANWQTRIARGLTVVLLVALGGGAHALDALGKMAPDLIKIAGYGSRDVFNAAFPLHDNHPVGEPTSGPALWSNMGTYGVVQFVVSILQGLGGSHSGTSAEAMQEFSYESFVAFTLFSLINAGGETVDALSYNAFQAFFRDGMNGVKNLRLHADAEIPDIGKIRRKISAGMIPRMSVFSLLFLVVGMAGEAGWEKILGKQWAILLICGVVGISIGTLYWLFPSASATAAQE